MADRYWVGGTGNWNPTNTANWSTMSGGAGGASVPTSSDNVFFDANSGGGTVTIGVNFENTTTVCGDFDSSAFTGNFTAQPTGSRNLNVNGSYILGASASYGWPTSTSSVNLVATTSGKVITTNGKTWSNGGFSISGAGGEYTLTDALNLSNGNTTAVFNFAAGTLNTADFNINITITGGTQNRFADFGSGSGTKVLNLGSSVITVNAQAASTVRISGSNLTVNAGTSKLSLVAQSSGSFSVSLNNYLFNELELNPGAGSKTVTISSPLNLNVFTSLGGTVTSRAVVQSAIPLQTGIVVSTSASAADTDFQGIYYVGPAISGDRLGDRGLNNGISFPSPKNCYRIGTGNWNATQWAANSGGTPDVNFFPLPQDIAVFDESTTAGTHTINYDAIGTIDMSARTSALTLAGTTAINLYGDWKFGTGITRTYSGAITFAGSKTQIILSNGISFANAFTINGPRSVVTLSDALTNTSTLTVTYGKLDTLNYNLTVSGISSTNSNIREISLGSSTVTLTSTSPITFTTFTGLTFNSGTSSIVCNTTSGFTFAGSNQTFYDISFSGTAAVGIGISGINTFNNLSITAPSAAGIKTVSISGDQTIGGTLTVTGSAGNQRVLLFSNALGTVRTLTTNAVSMADTDFRDITLAGTAAGSSVTRAGDWGGNTGITFPAPKTVYWNLAGSQNWNANAWAPSSGGSPSTDNFPLAQDTAVFDNSGSADTITLISSIAISAVDMSSRSTAMTITTSTNTVEIYGNWTFGSGVTSSSTTGTLTFVKRGTQTITSSGKTFGCNLTVGSGTVITSTEVQLADALAIEAAKTLTLTIGTFDAVTYNVTTGLFATSNTNIRNLKMGSGTWSITGTGTVWNISGAPVTYNVLDTLALEFGTAEIVLSDNTMTARTFTGGGYEYKKLTIGGTSSTSTTTINGNNSFGELASTKTVAHTILFQNGTTQYIKTFSVSGSSGNVVTLNRVSSGVWNLVLFGRTSGIDYLDVNNCTVAIDSPAEFYAGANSNNTGGNTRVVFTAAPSARTLYWVGGTGNWSDSARWSLSSGGAGGEVQPTSVDDAIFDSSSNATGYTVTIDSTNGARCKTFSMSGPASGNVTWAGTQPMLFHDDVSFPGAANITRSYTGTMYFCGTTSGYTFDPNGLALSNTGVIYGMDAEWTLSSAATFFSVFLVFGSIDTNNYNVTGSSFNVRANQITKCGVSFGSSTITMTGFTPFNFCHAIDSNGRIGRDVSRSKRALFTFNSGTSTLTGTLEGSGNDQINYALGGLTYYNVSHSRATSSTTRIWSSNTFNNFTCATVGRTQFLDDNNIINGTFTASGVSATSRIFVETGTKTDALGSLTSQLTLTVNAISTSFSDFRNIKITGSAAPVSVTSGGDLGGNDGFTFSSKTVYRVGTNTTWAGSSSWALMSGGSGSNDNTPLPQDTAVIDENTALTGTLTISGSISSLDCSTRTTGITLSHAASTVYYGSYILGSGVTVSGTSSQTFAGSGTMIFNSAGKTITFPINVNSSLSLPGTFKLGAALTISNTITSTVGTIDTDDYNLTATTATIASATTNTFDLGSSLITLTGTGTVWSLGVLATLNAGSSEILLSDTTTGGRTFAGGGKTYNKLTIGGATGVSTLTISDSINTFAEIASTKTVAHTIAFVATIQRVAAWSVTGTSGNVVTLSGTTGAIVYTGTGDIDIDYMNPSSLQAYPEDTWYIGTNSIFASGLNFYLEAAPTPPVGSAGAMFLLFL